MTAAKNCSDHLQKQLLRESSSAPKIKYISSHHQQLANERDETDWTSNSYFKMLKMRKSAAQDGERQPFHLTPKRWILELYCEIVLEEKNPGDLHTPEVTRQLLYRGNNFPTNSSFKPLGLAFARRWNPFARSPVREGFLESANTFARNSLKHSI